MSKRAFVFLLILAFNGVQRGAAEYLVPGLERVFRILVVAGDGIVALLAFVVLLRSRSFYGAKAWIAFAFCSALTVLYNIDTAAFALQLSGLREPLFFLSSLVLIHDILLSAEAGDFERAVTWFITALAIVQIPTSLLQFARYGAGDYVGGTFGWGGPGLVSLLAFLSAFYLLSHHSISRGDDTIDVRRIALVSLLLLPCIVNETKVSFILLPVFVILASNIRRIGQLIPLMIVGVVLFSALNYLYSSSVQDTDKLLDADFLERYLFYDRRESVDMPRFQKLAITTSILSTDPASLFLGLGYGAFTGGNILESSSFREKYFFLFGARMFLNTIIAQGGVLGVLVLLWGTLGFMLKPRPDLPVPGRRFRLFVFVVFLGVWIYTDAFLQRTFAGLAAYWAVWVSIERDIDGGDDPESSHDSGPDE